MFTLDGMRKLHGWTDASLNLLLDHLSVIPAAEFTKELQGFGFPSIRAQVVHLLNCEGFWVHILQGIPFQDRDPADYHTAGDARLLERQMSAQTLRYLDALSEEQLNSNVELHFPDGDIAVRTPALVLHHVLTHAFHHKGQVVAMCRLLGYPAPDTDLNQFE